MDTHKVKFTIHELYNSLNSRKEKPFGLMDISDCLFQVYNKIELVKNPETMLSALMNYIYVIGFSNKIKFIGRDQELLNELADYNNSAGLNAKYRSDLTDKSQFYSFIERMPKR